MSVGMLERKKEGDLLGAVSLLKAGLNLKEFASVCLKTLLIFVSTCEQHGIL